MKLTLPYPPTANLYWRHWRGRLVTSTEARAYKLKVGQVCAAARLKPLDGPVHVFAEVYRPARRGDLDNSLKVLLDSIKGFAFHDDSQVSRIEVGRHEDKENPRVEITVEAA